MVMLRSNSCLLRFTLGLIGLSALASAQTQPERVQAWVLNQPWRFHPGDNAAWKEPAFDDSGWSTLLTSKRWTEQGVATDPSRFAW